MKQTLARNDEHPEYYDPGLPRELDDALSTCVICPCGGRAITARLLDFNLPSKDRSRDKNDDNALICDACPRAVRYVDDWMTTAGGWNKDIEQENSKTLLLRAD